MRLMLVVVFAWAVFPAALAQHAPDQGTMPNPPVHAIGCVSPGVENGCTTLKDKKTGDVYTLFFASDAPPPNTGISLEGRVHQGMTTCMQGTAVDVAKWTKVKMKCEKTKSVPPPQ